MRKHSHARPEGNAALAARVTTAQPTHHQLIPRLAGYTDSMESACMVGIYVMSDNVIKIRGSCTDRGSWSSVGAIQPGGDQDPNMVG